MSANDALTALESAERAALAAFCRGQQSSTAIGPSAGLNVWEISRREAPCERATARSFLMSARLRLAVTGPASLTIAFWS